MTEKTIVLLGRHGDIINVLPLAYRLHKEGEKVNWLVSKEYAPTLEGASYVTVKEWPGSQDTLQSAIFSNRSRSELIVAQAWQNRDQRRLTDSFSREQWRLSGFPNDFGYWPLVFDNRSVAGENGITDQHPYPCDEKVHPIRPLVLVATDGLSSPFKMGAKLIAMIRGLGVDVVDLRHIKAERIYDLLGLFDKADCLVTIDTMHLHLARASMCPVVALINTGWHGSVPPPQTLQTFRYAEAEKNLHAVVESVSKIISRRLPSVCVISQIHGQTPRHLRARATWPKDSLALTFDHRPRFKELFQSASIYPGRDVLIWTNDDVAFAPGAMEAIARHARKFDFGCVRRNPSHIGRECFWFSRDFLNKHWSDMPDPYLSMPKQDLILARWLRKLRGIPTTHDNLMFDFLPVDHPPGLVTHEDHESSWLNHLDSFEAQHNEHLWRFAA